MNHPKPAWYPGDIYGRDDVVGQAFVYVVLASGPCRSGDRVWVQVLYHDEVARATTSATLMPWLQYRYEKP